MYVLIKCLRTITHLIRLRLNWLYESWKKYINSSLRCLDRLIISLGMIITLITIETSDHFGLPYTRELKFEPGKAIIQRIEGSRRDPEGYLNWKQAEAVGFRPRSSESQGRWLYILDDGEKNSRWKTEALENAS